MGIELPQRRITAGSRAVFSNPPRARSNRTIRVGRRTAAVHASQVVLLQLLDGVQSAPNVNVIVGDNRVCGVAVWTARMAQPARFRDRAEPTEHLGPSSTPLRSRHGSASRRLPKIENDRWEASNQREQVVASPILKPNTPPRHHGVNNTRDAILRRRTRGESPIVAGQRMRLPTPARFLRPSPPPSAPSALL